MHHSSASKTLIDPSLPGAPAAKLAPLKRRATERLQAANAHPVLSAILRKLAQLAYLRIIRGDEQLPQPPKGNPMLPTVRLQSVQVAVHAQLCFQTAWRIVDACTGKDVPEMTPSRLLGSISVLVMAVPQSSTCLRLRSAASSDAALLQLASLAALRGFDNALCASLTRVDHLTVA